MFCNKFNYMSQFFIERRTKKISLCNWLDLLSPTLQIQFVKIRIETLFHAILSLKLSFSHIYFSNIYKEIKYEANQLFMNEVTLENGIGKIIYKRTTQYFEYVYVL